MSGVGYDDFIRSKGGVITRVTVQGNNLGITEGSMGMNWVFFRFGMVEICKTDRVRKRFAKERR